MADLAGQMGAIGNPEIPLAAVATAERPDGQLRGAPRDLVHVLRDEAIRALAHGHGRTDGQAAPPDIALGKQLARNRLRRIAPDADAAAQLIGLRPSGSQHRLQRFPKADALVEDRVEPVAARGPDIVQRQQLVEVQIAQPSVRAQHLGHRPCDLAGGLWRAPIGSGPDRQFAGLDRAHLTRRLRGKGFAHLDLHGQKLKPGPRAPTRHNALERGPQAGIECLLAPLCRRACDPDLVAAFGQKPAMRGPQGAAGRVRETERLQRDDIADRRAAVVDLLGFDKHLDGAVLVVALRIHGHKLLEADVDLDRVDFAPRRNSGMPADGHAGLQCEAGDIACRPNRLVDQRDRRVGNDMLNGHPFQIAGERAVLPDRDLAETHLFEVVFADTQSQQLMDDLHIVLEPRPWRGHIVELVQMPPELDRHRRTRTRHRRLRPRREGGAHVLGQGVDARRRRRRQKRRDRKIAEGRDNAENKLAANRCANTQSGPDTCSHTQTPGGDRSGNPRRSGNHRNHQDGAQRIGAALTAFRAITDHQHLTAPDPTMRDILWVDETGQGIALRIALAHISGLAQHADHGGGIDARARQNRQHRLTAPRRNRHRAMRRQHQVHIRVCIEQEIQPRNIGRRNGRPDAARLRHLRRPEPHGPAHQADRGRRVKTHARAALAVQNAAADPDPDVIGAARLAHLHDIAVARGLLPRPCGPRPHDGRGAVAAQRR